MAEGVARAGFEARGGEEEVTFTTYWHSMTPQAEGEARYVRTFYISPANQKTATLTRLIPL